MKRQFLLSVLLISGYLLNAQVPEVNANDGVALDGYDLVSYHKEGPVKGLAKHSVTFKETAYWFSNADNASEFEEDPQRYLPEYGGWCAYAMGLNGELVEVDPNSFKIIDGRLYLFYNSVLNNTLKKWNRNESELLPEANKNWKKHLQ